VVPIDRACAFAVLLDSCRIFKPVIVDNMPYVLSISPMTGFNERNEQIWRAAMGYLYRSLVLDQRFEL
jgi:hypothetical protein